jgi:hypothetical protein
MPRRPFCNVVLAFLLAVPALFAQSQNATIDGQVTDKSGAVVPQATVKLTETTRNLTLTAQTDNDGHYSFPNLVPGFYNLSIEAAGFKTFSQQNIQVLINQSRRTDAILDVGDASTRVEVSADTAQLNYDTGAQADSVPPQIVNRLPLLVQSGTPRNAAQFVSFLPGVNTGTSTQPYNARINGGLKMGDEAIMDGVSMQEGTMSQSGMVSLYDFPSTPDMVSEVTVQTSSYEPQYGVTTGGVIVLATRSGTDDFHGGVFEYFRNKTLNASQFTNQREAGDIRPKDNENQFGGFIGGPVKLPFLPFIWGSKHKTYFFHDEEYLRSLGGTVRPVVTIPSMQQRMGDFSDLGVPIYDPRSSPNLATRTQFPNNQIPITQQSALALQWMQFLPTPSSPGPYNNYLSTPVSDGILSNLNEYLYKIDHYWGEKDHFFATVWRQKTGLNSQCALPLQLCTSNPSNPQDAWVNRFNWDHTFTPTLLSHFAYGYLNRNEGYGSVAGQDPDLLPKIPNAVAYNASPAASFSGGGATNYASWGNTSGPGPLNKSTRPSHVANELITWVHGTHTFKFGGEYRHLQQVFRNNGNQSGTVGFTAANTGIPGIASGNPFASLLIGAVDNGNVNVYNVAKYGAEQRGYSAYAGDTWKVTRNLTLNLGVRWDKFTPTWETNNQLAFFSFAPNPGAGGLPGSLAFAGNKWGDASFGKQYPETPFNGAVAPRFGFAYNVGKDTVIRGGYGIFYTQAFYPGWGAGMSLDGFNPLLRFGDSLSGYGPSFYLDNGFPAYSKAPNVSATADNGTNGPNYRPTYGNHLSNAQQWNLTIERKFGPSTVVSAAYVGSKGTHLPSQNQPLNALNPTLLNTLGATALNTEFQAGQTSLFGVNVPYADWVNQLNTAGACKPTVAQALSRFPQYCAGLTGQNENQGNSSYNSLQLSMKRSFSNGVDIRANYTWSKLIADSSTTTQSTDGGQVFGINPFQGSRNRAISPDDVTHVGQILAVYELPFGPGKRFLGRGGVLGHLVGGWTLASSMKFTSGLPFNFVNSNVCGVPQQFRANCIPGTVVGANVLTQSFPNVDVNKPVFNAGAFEPVSMFENGNYLGSGSRISSVRGSPYRNTSLSVSKKISVTERMALEFRAEMFNIFNNHYFTCDGNFVNCTPFNNDPSSANFGTWSGTVTQPRNIQLVGRFTF